MPKKAAYAAGADDDKDKDDSDDDGTEPDPTEVDNELVTVSEGNGKKEKYSKVSGGYSIPQLVDVVKQLQKQLKQTQDQLAVERSHRIDAERYGKLQTMVSEGVLLDINKEMGRLCYAKMPADEAFDGAVEFISDHAQRMPTNLLLPSWDDVPPAPGSPGREKYSKEMSDKARVIAEQKAVNGESVDFVQVLEQVASGKL